MNETEIARLKGIEWLAQNDRNGCYRDNDCHMEGFSPMTIGQVIDQLIAELNENAGSNTDES